MNSQPKRILFVCLGNIVRSPLAEAMFAHLAQEAGLAEKYQVDSAGTASYHIGESPDERMRRVAASEGLVYDHRARQFSPEDFENFDLIVAMDEDNRADLLRQARTAEQRSKIRLLREFDAQADGDSSVPDPYYGGIDGFRDVYQIVERSCRALLDGLEEGRVEQIW